ncbi:hypothetical protein E2C01_095881 [Portunus trituberculatus]|uniref:Uncharacterized protein n=1 Tax=Portunus trituberculatus TaxID=210409 RepID=A0A5B7JR07_PORTR|nr:hypothetical protein [Portunus trituberculatus]
MSQVRRYGLTMSPFRTYYFCTFENFSALRTSAPCLVVRRLHSYFSNPSTGSPKAKVPLAFCLCQLGELEEVLC